ncbi:polysaccharide biosynthesis/export family protein [Calothrix sp. FACHB-1219]|uniref:polysaccharide biosynthesis/export family protein n=1 Tax=unclassified Calothrix TaxID=2619626 RepID=UPI0016899E97|nr:MULTISPECIES: polysaccharide biosynthesis/export family protein [unclassified Calothrix]MBD2207382.1 polysaccharide biosynthesis/export family protein [Calothrix sp. FACHB-168]MBD2218429.1 polysaccharide biosynthesis/export family protein [Calothrix sp. FACHB-1219]
MSIFYNSPMRVFSALFFFSLQLSVFWTTAFSVVAQTLPFPEQPSGQTPSSPSATEAVPGSLNNEVSPQLNRYLLGPGDSLSVVIQRPPGPYRLGAGDSISVVVQRFPDLSFQALINPEGNIIVPLINTVSLQGLTLDEAQAKIRSLLNRYVVEPIVVLSLVGQRPDLSFQAVVNPEGNILVPQVGTLSLQGLSVEEAQEKIRLALSRVVTDPIVVASLASPRPVQVTISGEVFRPGIYPITSVTPRVADALLTSGGTTINADLRQVQVRRRLLDGTVIAQTVDLYTALQNGSALPNLRLQDGDAIIVPRREIGTDNGYDRNLIARSTLAIPQIRIRVLNYAAGGIANQMLPNGSTFIDALGGINLDTANIRDIALVRFDPERGQAVTQRLDAKKALGGDMSQNVPLQDNDVIVVGRNLIGRITNALNTITQPFFNVQSFIRFFDFFTGGFR